jgi:hypothetical protein
LKDENVLIEAIRQGVGSLTWKDYFGYASAVQENGYYVGLVAGSLPNVTLDSASMIVKPDKVKEQLKREAAKQSAGSSEEYPQSSGEGEKSIHDGEVTTISGSHETLIRRFHGSVNLDADRMGRDAGQIADEVLSHLSGLVGANVEISLEINVEVPDGIPENVIRIVKENAVHLNLNHKDLKKNKYKI